MNNAQPDNRTELERFKEYDALSDINYLTGAARESQVDIRKFQSLYNWVEYAQQYILHLEGQVESYEKNNAEVVEQLDAMTDKFTTFDALGLANVHIDFDIENFVHPGSNQAGIFVFVWKYRLRL
jgi:hypothetical protein